MEQYCALLIWQRSVAKYGLRYTCMLSAGDSKLLNHIVEKGLW